MIISPRYDAIREALLRSDVGLTLFPIETGLKGDASKAVLCAVPARKLPKIKETVVNIDAASFVLVTSTAEISGRGFTLPR